MSDRSMLSHGGHYDTPGGHPGSDALMAKALKLAAEGKSLYIPPLENQPRTVCAIIYPPPAPEWGWRVGWVSR